MRAWLTPQRPAEPETVTDPGHRHALRVEIILVFALTLGLAGARSLLSLADSLLQPEPLSDQQVAINAPQAAVDVIDLLEQLLGVAALLAWAGLGLYLLWRGGIRLAAIGLDKRSPWANVLRGIGLTALIGIPGLAFYFVAWKLGFNLAIHPSTLDDSWWRPMTLTLSAVGNAAAEEVLVVGYLLTRLRQLGTGENTGLIGAALLRGSYHLYQGIGGFIGNFVMGLVFGRIWQRTNRLWPLIIAHTLLDVLAFVGYAVLSGHLAWLP